MRLWERIKLVNDIENEINGVIDMLKMTPIFNRPTPTFCQYGADTDDMEIVAGDITVYVNGNVDISDLLAIPMLMQKWKYLQIYHYANEYNFIVSSTGEITLRGKRKVPVITATIFYTFKNYSDSVINLDKIVDELPFEVEIVWGEK